MEEYIETLDKYFKLKAKYDKQLNKKKHSILVDEDRSRKEKRSDIQKIKMSCIGCGRAVGTIFSDKDRTYSAVCGNRVDPCNLHISIKKGTTFNVGNHYNSDLDTRNDVRNKIVTTKLDVLFGLIDDVTMEETFEELKSQHADISSYVTMVEKLLEGDNEERKRNIRDVTRIVQELLEEQKDLLQEYMKDTAPSKMREVIELYVTKIIPAFDVIAQNKYDYREVEKCVVDIDSSDTKKCLMTKYKNIEEFENVATQPVVVEFKLK